MILSINCLKTGTEHTNYTVFSAIYTLLTRRLLNDYKLAMY